ncbi:MAG: glycosyltransferase family 2 protein [Bacteroidia bacterium]|nr:glycosyltransferase family 2 protein [Bacteroidia bacterium]
MPAKISIVVPCYNAADFIAETLFSVFSQTYTNYEVLIIDDGSTDKSKAVIDGISHHSLKYFWQENQGVSMARNNGLEKTTGDYVLFLDADDLLEPDFLKTRIKKLEENENLLFACSKAILIDENSAPLNKEYEAVCENVEEEICNYTADCCSCPSNYLIRNIFKEEGLRFHPSLSNAADRFFLLELNKLGKGTLVNGSSKLKYRIHEKSMSKNISPKNILDLIKFYELVLNYKLIPSRYYFNFKFKTFRICFSESLLIKKPLLALRSCLFVLMKF